MGVGARLSPWSLPSLPQSIYVGSTQSFTQQALFSVDEAGAFPGSGHRLFLENAGLTAQEDEAVGQRSPGSSLTARWVRGGATACDLSELSGCSHLLFPNVMKSWSLN